MAPHSSILAWDIPWTEEPGGLQSRGVTKELDMTEDMQQRKENENRHCCQGDNTEAVKDAEKRNVSFETFG